MLHIVLHFDKISIHALRVEGDLDRAVGLPDRNAISIHALRVEGDAFWKQARASWVQYFYPRPPGGGRQGRHKRSTADI